MKVRIRTLHEMFQKGMSLTMEPYKVKCKDESGYYSEDDSQTSIKTQEFYDVKSDGLSYYYVDCSTSPIGTWAKWACEVKEEPPVNEDLIVVHNNGWTTRTADKELFAKHDQGEEFEVTAPRRTMTQTEIEQALGYEIEIQPF